MLGDDGVKSISEGMSSSAGTVTTGDSAETSEALLRSAVASDEAELFEELSARTCLAIEIPTMKAHNYANYSRIRLAAFLPENRFASHPPATEIGFTALGAA